MNLQTEKKNTKTLVLYCQIHQPRRLQSFSYFDIGTSAPYFDDDLNRKIIHSVAQDCYLPTNAILLDLIKRYPEIRICFSISGAALEQFQMYAPEVLTSFQALVKTGSVEMLGETNYHSLSSEMPGDEFEQQVIQHREKIHEIFGVTPNVFRNTELIYSNEIGDRVSALGFKGILCDGVSQVLHGRSTYQTYRHHDLNIFLRACSLSDDIGFRFKQGDEILSVGQYIAWLEAIGDKDEVVLLGLDYETFGEHQKNDTGIFEFLKGFIEALWLHPNFDFKTPGELIQRIDTAEDLDVSVPISWADEAKDLSAWLGNNLQKEAFAMLQSVSTEIYKLAAIDLLHTWRCLQTSDHLYYMSTKKFSDGSVHSYFSPYASPYEAFINYMNVLSDFEILINKKIEENNSNKKEAGVELERERRDQLAEPIWVENLKQEYNPLIAR